MTDTPAAGFEVNPTNAGKASVTYVVWVNAPLVPVMTTTEVPPAVALVVATVKVTGAPPAGIEDALRVAVTPDGAPGIVTVRFVPALKLCSPLTAIELVPPPPGVRFKTAGVADIEKFGFVEAGKRASKRLGPLGEPQPVTRSKPVTALKP